MAIRTRDAAVDGVARDWRVPGRVHAVAQVNLECDEALAGTCTSAGIRSEVPDATGLTAAIFEEEGLKSSGDFNRFDLVPPLQSRSEAGDSIVESPMQPLRTRRVSVHPTCGCCVATHDNRGTVGPDGSLIPASIGAGPQLWVSGWIDKLRNYVATRLMDRDATLLT